jgi:hypothetical protein
MLRMNVVRGKFDARKFAALWSKLETRYGREALERMAGYDGREKDLRALVGDVTKALTPKAQAALEKRKDEIKSPDDLAAVVKLVLAETGPLAVKTNWVAFSVGGAAHMMVECTAETFGALRRLADWADERGLRLDDVVAEAVSEHLRLGGLMEAEASRPRDAAKHAHASQTRPEAVEA